ncbi:POK19 protein, partial [Grantiella picta]|nr:POK19 protein [Grantiella picta]
ISHVTGIPHSPTGQAIIERVHRMLKTTLERQRGGDEVTTPQMRLSKALFTINFLNGPESEPLLPVFRHFSNDKRRKLKIQPPVLIRDPESLKVQGPFP